MKRLGALLAALALLLVAAGCGSDHNEADVTFARDMVPHHEQALEMVTMTRGHDLDPAVQDVVDGIEKAQSPEIKQMKAWLEDWGAKPASMSMSGSMHGGDDDGHGSMPGMMSDADMTKLQATADPAFQQLWLEMMVEHHEGAVSMAKSEVARGQYADAIALAKSIQKGQTEEIATMKALLAD